MKSSINERIWKVIKYFHENSIANFVELTQIPTQEIKKLFQINKKTGKYPEPSAEILIAILSNYPGIYSNWLLRGKGEMLLKQMFDKLCNPLEKEFYAQLEAQRQEIKTLMIENVRLTEEIKSYKNKGLEINYG